MYLQECLAPITSEGFNVCGTVCILASPLTNMSSPDNLKKERGIKRIYIFFCTEFFLKLYNFVNILLFLCTKITGV